MNSTVVDKGLAVLRGLVGRLGIKRTDGRLDTVDRLCDFAATRAAFVSQKKLYGYLKTRMGTRFVSAFEDDLFIQSVNIAKMHVFAAGLSDLTIFCVAKASVGGLEPDQARDLALECYRRGLDANADHAPDADSMERWREEFDHRLAGVNWANAASSGEVFDASQTALLRWAPIAEELKKFDAEIVRNSIRFAWNEVRADLRKRLDPAAVADEWRAMVSGPGSP